MAKPSQQQIDQAVAQVEATMDLDELRLTVTKLTLSAHGDMCRAIAKAAAKRRLQFVTR